MSVFRSRRCAVVVAACSVLLCVRSCRDQLVCVLVIVCAQHNVTNTYTFLPRQTRLRLAVYISQRLKTHMKGQALSTALHHAGLCSEAVRAPSPKNDAVILQTLSGAAPSLTAFLSALVSPSPPSRATSSWAFRSWMLRIWLHLTVSLRWSSCALSISIR